MSAADRATARELPIRISAKADYAIRACIELAAAAGEGLVKGERIAASQGIPLKFLLNILAELRHAQIVRSQRGSDGGYQLARPPEEITLAQVILAVERDLSTVQDVPPDELSYAGPAESLRDVWLAIQTTLASLLTSVTLADLADGRLPQDVLARAREAHA